jgi:hypothetical protein
MLCYSDMFCSGQLPRLVSAWQVPFGMGQTSLAQLGWVRLRSAWLGHSVIRVAQDFEKHDALSGSAAVSKLWGPLCLGKACAKNTGERNRLKKEQSWSHSTMLTCTRLKLTLVIVFVGFCVRFLSQPTSTPPPGLCKHSRLTQI